MAYTTINKSGDYFNTKLYTGTATSAGDTQAITGVGFQPDWVWIKNRSGAYQHVLYDVVRGVNKEIRTAETSAEFDSGTNGYLSAFNSDGFTTTRGTNTGNHVNVNGSEFASWNWLANGAGSANTDGTISSTVSVNTTSGFSIVSYTGNGSAGATIGHGLSQKPSIIITKRRDSTSNWLVYSSELGATKYLELETTNAGQTATSRWNDTEPTSSVFSVGTSTSANPSSGTMIAYCFAEKTGYSKFGSYTGNGNADGTFVYTGFKPAWVMVKSTDVSATDWQMHDGTRSPFNIVNNRVQANKNNAETTNYALGDFLSNGFKLRQTNNSWNGSGNSYIYMAFASAPLVGTNNVPANAR